MSIRRKLSISVAFVLVLTLIMSLSASAQQSALGGAAQFRDANAQSDSLVIRFTGAAELALGSTYEGWVVDDLDNKVSTGQLGRGPWLNGTYVDPNGADLLAQYPTFLITIEDLNDGDPAPSGVVAYGGINRGWVLSHIGNLLGDSGTATQLRAQAAAAVASAQTAASATTLAGKQAGAQAVVDALDSAGGVVDFANQVAADASAITSSAPSDMLVVQATADEIVQSAGRVIGFADRARDAAELIKAASVDDLAVAKEVDNLVALTSRMLNGTDENANGAAGDAGIEGGAVTTYTKAQDLGQFRPGIGVPPKTGDAMLPVFALITLVVGMVVVVAGGFLVLRNRRTVLATAS
jgi:LPXTG-motif cell wall-anchored protein